MSAGEGMSVERRGDRTRLIVTGDLDLSIRDRFMAQVTRIAETGSAMTIDLRGLSSIDSTGLSSVIQADRLARENGGPPIKVVVATSGSVRRMFELTLLHLTLDVSTG